ncbi:MAG: MerR family transcriptional regulator [Desulfuromonadales bacterium]|nr:MerR family transcriptional regulator [Desulfuromonadales bacterium]
MNTSFPDKMYYKIGEVAQLLGVRTSVLRFWEGEFSFLKPDKSSTGQRLYTKKEVEILQEVKRLLYTEKYTLEGVKKRLSGRGKNFFKNESPQDTSRDQSLLLKEIKAELLALRCQL